jgi:cytochrome P450
MTVAPSPPAPIDELVRRLFALDRELIQDPYPLYRRLRDEAPVHFLDAGVVLVSPHALAEEVFRDAKRFHAFPTRAKRFQDARAALSEEEIEMVGRIYALESGRLTNLHGDRHRRVRSAAQRFFTPKKVTELATIVEQIVDGELTNALAHSDCGVTDLAAFANRVPLLVVMEMIGAPYEHAEMVRAWGDARSAMNTGARYEPTAVRVAHAAMTEFRAYVDELIEQQRHASDNSTLAAALLDATAADQLAEDELVEFYLLLLFAGHETTRNLIATGIRSLLKHRDQWELLCANPSLAAGAVEEMLRYDAPGSFFPRLAACDIELGDVLIPEGTQVLPMIGAANRDPLVFDGPDDLRITRNPNRHISFGGGSHFCLGASIARMEGRIVLQAVSQRFPQLELTVEPASVPMRPTHSGRGPSVLEARLGPQRR